MTIIQLSTESAQQESLTNLDDWSIVSTGAGTIFFLVRTAANPPNLGGPVPGAPLTFDEIYYVRAEPLVMPTPQGLHVNIPDIVTPLCFISTAKEGVLLPTLVIHARSLPAHVQTNLMSEITILRKRLQESAQQAARELRLRKEAIES